MPHMTLPTPLRPYADKKSQLEVPGATVAEALLNLTQAHPKLKAHLFGEDGKLRSFVNVYVNDEDIRYLAKLDTKLQSSDTVSIIPSIAGGLQ